MGLLRYGHYWVADKLIGGGISRVAKCAQCGVETYSHSLLSRNLAWVGPVCLPIIHEEPDLDGLLR
jgi:hypothetical protein